MSSTGSSQQLAKIVSAHEADILTEWLREQSSADLRRDGLVKEAELREQSREFLSLLRTALSGDASASTDGGSIDGAAWEPVKEMLRALGESRTRLGFTPTEVATFVFSLKKPLFARLAQASGSSSAAALGEQMWAATTLLDRLGLYTTEVYQRVREEVIARQQQEMLELSTPVVKLWDGILALPMIGTLDSGRTQVVMESLLNRIVETGAEIAILDITGVPTVDTLVAQHLIKTVTAARLMGADCIISGIRPQIAQTIVHLGVDLSAVITKSTLADAFAIALQRRGMRVTKPTVNKA